MKKKIIIYVFIIITLPVILFAENQEKEDIIINEKEASPSSSFSQSKFVPDISLILDFSYVKRNMRDDEFETQKIPDYPNKISADSNKNNEMNSKNGFNLNYSEITFYSVVDPYFDLFAVCHLSENEAALEEGYFTTTSLPLGFKIKGGKFLSNFGRINEQHAHCWDFAELPLVYKSFFGSEGLNETGIRLTWVAPVDFYLMLGAEALSGCNEKSFGREGFQSTDGSINVKVSNGPNLYTGYIKTSFDLGDMVILAGSSGAFGKTRLNNNLDEEGVAGNALYGDSYIVGGDLTLKYQFDSIRFLSLQSEYLYRRIKGDYYEENASDISEECSIDKKQSGFYLQLAAKPAKRWRFGVRYDLLHLNRVKQAGNNLDIPESLPRYSAMAEFNPTEFSRFRIQYNLDKSNYAGDGSEFKRKTNHELIFQVNLAIGAHGAHSF